MRYFKDERYDNVISEDELRKDFELYLEVMPFEETKGYTFNNYINDCCSKNGILTEIK